MSVLETFNAKILFRNISKGRSAFWFDGEREYEAFYAQAFMPHHNLAVGDVIYFPSPPLERKLYGVIVDLALRQLCPFIWEYNNCPTCPYIDKNMKCTIGMLDKNVLKIGGLVFEDEAEALDFADEYLKMLNWVHFENLSLMHGVAGQDAWKAFFKFEKRKVRGFGFKAFHLEWVNEIERLCRVDFDPRFIHRNMPVLDVTVKRLRRA